MRWAPVGAGAIATALALSSGCGSDANAKSAAHPLCVDGKSVDGTYPKVETSVALHATLPDLDLDTADEAGQPAKVALHDYFEPCAATSRLLVVRVSALWCGTCRWHAAHTKELLQLDVGARLELLDLVIADDDNAPPGPKSLPPWRARIDAPQRLALDPDYRLGAMFPTNAPLPAFVLVDTRTMIAVDAFGDPDPDLLEQRIRSALADLDGTPRPAPKPTTLVDGLFTRNRWDLLRDMKLPGTPPPDPTNAKADDPAAAALGKKLFSDAALSPNGKVSCASCHAPDKQLSDGLARSTAGVGLVERNSPAIALASHDRWQFWDGRADTLWVQALGPPENANEFNSSRLFVDHVVFTKYRAEYEAVWGAMPDLASTRFPAQGKPGSPEWASMSEADQEAATRVYVDVGKSVAAFERTFRVEPSALDRYVAGDLNALSQGQKDGLAAFFAAGCTQCHYGPRLTDDAFHSVRFPTGRADGSSDRGRSDGVVTLLGAEFGTGTAWSDAPSKDRVEGLIPAPRTLGAFKTPTLRGVPGSAPYGHGGTFASLGEVVKNHRGLPPENGHAAGALEPWLVPVDDSTGDSISAFLEVLSAVPIIP
jgi:cytochrome c peroxidase